MATCTCCGAPGMPRLRWRNSGSSWWSGHMPCCRRPGADESGAARYQSLSVAINKIAACAQFSWAGRINHKKTGPEPGFLDATIGPDGNSGLGGFGVLFDQAAGGVQQLFAVKALFVHVFDPFHFHGARFAAEFLCFGGADRVDGVAAVAGALAA